MYVDTHTQGKRQLKPCSELDSLTLYCTACVCVRARACCVCVHAWDIVSVYMCACAKVC